LVPSADGGDTAAIELPRRQGLYATGLQPKTASPRLPPVHSAACEGQQRVDSGCLRATIRELPRGRFGPLARFCVSASIAEPRNVQSSEPRIFSTPTDALFGTAPPMARLRLTVPAGLQATTPSPPLLGGWGPFDLAMALRCVQGQLVI
jgi:hypothetical protein